MTGFEDERMNTSSTRSREAILVIESATIAHPGGAVVLRDLSWTVREGESWAVVGPAGSGKTTLAEALLGRRHLESGSMAWPFLEQLRATGRAVGWPSEVIRLVSFREESWLFSPSRHYYQQRFNFIEPQDDLTLDAFLHSGTTASEGEIADAAARLGIGELRPLSLIKLSNGQVRRARIARALLSHPELLILDDPFLGLDATGRGDLAAILGDLVRKGMRVLLICRPDDIPAWVTHVFRLGGQTAGVLESSERALAPPGFVSAPIIELNDVHVSYGDSRILRGISWTVRAGERWAVLGPNGSGKTTLLSLLSGDHPQAYANDIRLFGRQRGSGESIWDIKRNVGLVSPELHVYFSEPLTAGEAAATGFFDVLVRRRTTPQQQVIVRELFEYFAIEPLLDRPFGRLSTGEQRLVLLIRALVKSPPLLILDEPFQGLDARQIDLARRWLDERLRPDQTLLFVTHYPQELPRTVTRTLRLEAGQVVV